MPLAAQVACTPVVAAISGQVSLVAVGANLLAAPAVAPATVLGLAGGLLGLLWSPLGVAVAAPAAWSAGWIIAVARWGADVPTAAVDWGTGPVPLVLLTVLCLLAVPLAPRLLGRPVTTLACTGLLVVVMLVRPPTPGLAAATAGCWRCATSGQGDALVLRAGAGSAVVVDAGPEPAPTDACLDRLEVTAVPLLVLTHFHADHVGGVAGVLDGREVGEVEGTALLDPPRGCRRCGARGRPRPGAGGVRPHAAGRRGDAADGVAASRCRVRATPAESAPNNASVVLVAEVGGVRVLLTGDVEPSAQAALARDLAGLRVDVLKVPHHGSRHQDLDWLDLARRAAGAGVGGGGQRLRAPRPRPAGRPRRGRRERVAHRRLRRRGRGGPGRRARCRRPRIGWAAPWLAPPPPRRSSATSSS